MKKLLLAVVVCVLAAVPSVAYPQYSAPAAAGTGTAELVIPAHVIEIETQQGFFVVWETIMFKNVGGANYTGDFRTWVPDKAEIMGISSLGHQTENVSGSGTYTLANNVLSWNASEPIPPGGAVMYRLGYSLPFTVSEGTFSDTASFSKKLRYPTYINYDYTGSSVGSGFVIKSTVPGMSISFEDDKGNRLNPVFDGESYTWVVPEFSGISVKYTKSKVSMTQIAIYGAIGILIILIIAYPILRSRSQKVKDLETAVAGRFQSQEDAGDHEGEEHGDDIGELHEQKEEILKMKKELDEDHESGKLSDEEYEEMRLEYDDREKEIDRRILELR